MLLCALEFESTGQFKNVEVMFELVCLLAYVMCVCVILFGLSHWIFASEVSTAESLVLVAPCMISMVHREASGTIVVFLATTACNWHAYPRETTQNMCTNIA